MPGECTLTGPWPMRIRCRRASALTAPPPLACSALIARYGLSTVRGWLSVRRAGRCGIEARRPRHCRTHAGRPVSPAGGTRSRPRSSARRQRRGEAPGSASRRAGRGPVSTSISEAVIARSLPGDAEATTAAQYADRSQRAPCRAQPPHARTPGKDAEGNHSRRRSTPRMAHIHLQPGHRCARTRMKLRN
jgi:hypothetical protein